MAEKPTGNFEDNRRIIRRRRVLIRLVCAGLALAAGSRRAFPADAEAVASLWYRGRPAGVPRADDLADSRAAGFTTVTWPASAGGVDALKELATTADLGVLVRAPTAPVTFATALTPHEFVDVRVGQDLGAAIAPLAWRAIAHGARVISFDSGRREGAGIAEADRRRPAWVSAAVDVARQLRANGALFGQCRRGPPLVFDPPVPAGLDVTLLEARKSWVLVATNGANARAHAVVHLPVDIPYALWLNLLDASTMAMLQQSRGPQWTANLEPYGVRIYVIDKTLK
jgi:hypothetical protein